MVRAGRFLVAGAILVVISLGLFSLFVNRFSEGYDGAWGEVVRNTAWFAFIAGVGLGLAGLVSLLRRTV